MQVIKFPFKLVEDLISASLVHLLCGPYNEEHPRNSTLRKLIVLCFMHRWTTHRNVHSPAFEAESRLHYIY